MVGVERAALAICTEFQDHKGIIDRFNPRDIQIRSPNGRKILTKNYGRHQIRNFVEAKGSFIFEKIYAPNLPEDFDYKMACLNDQGDLSFVSTENKIT